MVKYVSTADIAAQIPEQNATPRRGSWWCINF